MSATQVPTSVAHLSSPLALRNGQTLPNRLMKSALSESLGAPDCGPSPELERLYARWATGGFGLVVTGNVMVDRRHRGEPGNVVIEDDRHIDGLRAWAQTFRGSGTPLWMQVNHPGRQANALVTKLRPVAPSAIGARVPGAVRPRALEDSEIRDIIERYATAASVAEAAGFDGVQLHGAHGYLITQFLSPLSNQRDDAWGGDAERRRTFVIEVLRAVRSAVRPDFAVGIKLNSADFQRGGFTEDESRDVVRELVAEGIDLIEISGGSYEKPAMLGAVRASTAAREAYFLEYAASVRELAGAVPIAVTGGFRTTAAMEAAVASAECDLVGLGRPAAVAPDVPRRVLEQGADAVRAGDVRVGLRSVLGKVIDLRQVDGALDLSWHTDQLHRLGAGREPDLDRSWARALVAMGLHNGPAAFRSKRG
ncbi:NADH:flavin oxidoreductase/NADH oxidase family protein [Nocardioides humilatus]|uniref:NADH:flavin oxidoreductase/NADH oxidase family protein n=1 Tax=Nocardioides humilatus TaxID=2607660 RepID=A0A5B1LAB8_9ACTN|nr:NADH:flavin oxidoreductase/NADH oxidase family protein [Nocardioides humilatus]KAA1417683.1 NADH:flavin oxidoreductase/NADH oxidase family protein [Nocardioides humilatus]